ncbi:MAG TPA: AI-2E family transporter YdiK [Nitrospira sp.]|nr:AI-2E family transporter YdiK [Nitrospira sp.]
MNDRRSDLTRDTLAVVFLFALIAASLWILWPFLGAVIWAIMIVVPTWSILLALQRMLWGKRWMAVAVMTLILLAVFLVPFSVGIAALVENFDQIAVWTTSLSHFTLPAPPDWLGNIPIAGPRLASSWQQFAALNREDMAARLSPYVGGVVRWTAGQIGSFGLLLTQILLTVIVAAVLYASGESAATTALRFGSRLAEERGEQAVRLAAQAIRGIALGVVLTALIHAALGGIGLLVVGMPFAMLLTAVMFISGVVQIGVGPIMLCAVAWLYWTGSATSAAVLLGWTILVSPVDNILRPILIRTGADLPLLLIFAGVIGGLISFGVVGIFIGPVVLAIVYTLFKAWIDESPSTGRFEERPGMPPTSRISAPTATD